jgi:hypothetical protein
VIVKADCERVSQLVSVINSSLWKVKYVNSYRTEAGNRNLAHWSQDVLGVEVEETVIKDIREARSRIVYSERRV